VTDSKTQRLRVKRALGYLFALTCLVWVFHDVHPQRLLSAIHITNWRWVGLAVFFDVLTYALQGVRWKLLLHPVGHIRSLKATQAIYVGLFTNEVAPLRLGEIVRAFLAAKWLHTGIAAVLPSIVVERFLDALWLVAGVGLVAMFVPLPKNLVHAGDALGALVLAATALFLWLVLRKERQLEHGTVFETCSGSRGKTAIYRLVASVAGGLRQIGLSSQLQIAVAISAAMLACQALAVWFIMLAFGLKLGIVAGTVVTIVVRLGTAIPNAPANVGSFQFFTVLALGLFSINKTTAAAFSIVDFAILTLPLWTFGILSLAASGMTFASIRRMARKALEAPEMPGAH
jgi:uncharacterized protein (TIRG00374 family)